MIVEQSIEQLNSHMTTEKSFVLIKHVTSSLKMLTIRCRKMQIRPTQLTQLMVTCCSLRKLYGKSGCIHCNNPTQSDSHAHIVLGGTTFHSYLKFTRGYYPS